MEKLKIELDLLGVETIDEINNSASSIFAKEDVSKILAKFWNRVRESIDHIEFLELSKVGEDYEKQVKEIEESINEPEAKFSIDEIKKAYNDIIGNDDYYEVDTDSADFTIKYGNEIVLESVSVDVSFNDILFNLTEELINTQE